MNKQLLQRRAVGVTPAKPVVRKRRRLALAAERQACRRKSYTASGPSRSDRLARAAALPLNRGASLIVVLVLSLGRAPGKVRRAPLAVAAVRRIDAVFAVEGEIN